MTYQQFLTEIQLQIHSLFDTDVTIQLHKIQKNNGVTFSMTAFLDEAKVIANSCAKEKNQEYFEKCILRNYGKMEVNAFNLSKYIETSSYISLKQDPQLRGVLDKAKSDKIITNDEFAHVVQVTQELINEGYRQQYKKNVINF